MLPFENLQGGADDDYFAEGLTEETIVGLGQIDPGRLGMIGRRSSMAYRGTGKKLDEIGRELGVDYLVEGSVRTANGRCRITARLVRARDQVQLWAETYERESNDLLGLQADFGGAIAGQIELLLSPQRAFTNTPRQTQDREAYDLYLRGRYYYNQMIPAAAARALDSFTRAAALDPAYALAWTAWRTLTHPDSSTPTPDRPTWRTRRGPRRAVRSRTAESSPKRIRQCRESSSCSTVTGGAPR